MKRGLWLAHAKVIDDGILIPGLAPRPNADLLLRWDAAQLRYRERSLALSWDEYLTSAALILNSTPGWRITFCRVMKGGVRGVAIAAFGSCRTRATELRDDIWTWRFRYDLFRAPDAMIPLWPGRPFRPEMRMEAERATVAALCTLLSERVDVRARLADPVRAARLIEDLQRGAQPTYIHSVGTTPDYAQIAFVLRTLDYQHHLNGRPLPTDIAPPLADAIQRVRERLAAGTYSHRERITDEQIRKALRRNYLEIEPWPFAALLDGGGPREGSSSA